MATTIHPLREHVLTVRSGKLNTGHCDWECNVIDSRESVTVEGRHSQAAGIVSITITVLLLCGVLALGCCTSLCSTPAVEPALLPK
jgi:hypothetical protein